MRIIIVSVFVTTAIFVLGGIAGQLFVDFLKKVFDDSKK